MLAIASSLCGRGFPARLLRKRQKLQSVPRLWLVVGHTAGRFSRRTRSMADGAGGAQRPSLRVLPQLRSVVCHVSICSCLSCCSADPPRLTRMREGARQRFEQKFTADANHDVLIAIYARSIALRSAIASLQ